MKEVAIPFLAVVTLTFLFGYFIGKNNQTALPLPPDPTLFHIQSMEDSVLVYPANDSARRSGNMMRLFFSAAYGRVEHDTITFLNWVKINP